MLHHRYFISVIIITLCINYNIVAMSLFYGENSSIRQVARIASHVNFFGNMIYQNRFPIGITAFGTVLVTSYDKPIVLYSTSTIFGLYLLYNQVRTDKIVTELVEMNEKKTNSINQELDQMNANLSDTRNKLGEVNKKVDELNKRVEPLADCVLSVKNSAEETSASVQKQNERFESLRNKLNTMRSEITELTKNQNSLRNLVATEANTTREHNTQNTERILAYIQNQKGAHSPFSSGLMVGIRASSFRPSFQSQSKIPS